jgi:uncharacterized RDD family membrane protein YckC
VRRLDNKPMDVYHSTLRALGDCLPLVDWITALFTKNNRALHDLLAGTVVVQAPSDPNDEIIVE